MQAAAALLQLHALLAFLPLLVTWNWESWSSCTFIFEIWVGSNYGLHLCAHSLITTSRWPLICNWGDHILDKLTLLLLQSGLLISMGVVQLEFPLPYLIWHSLLSLSRSCWSKYLQPKLILYTQCTVHECVSFLQICALVTCKKKKSVLIIAGSNTQVLSSRGRTLCCLCSCQLVPQIHYTWES